MQFFGLQFRLYQMILKNKIMMDGRPQTSAVKVKKTCGTHILKLIRYFPDMEVLRNPNCQLIAQNIYSYI